MVAPLQATPGDEFVRLIELGVERKGPTRSVTMPFPVSPARNSSLCQMRQVPKTLAEPISPRRLSPSPSPERGPSPDLYRLRTRASSEGDLLRSLEASAAAAAAGEGKDGRVIQSSRERRTQRMRRRRVMRGCADVVSNNGKPWRRARVLFMIDVNDPR